MTGSLSCCSKEEACGSVGSSPKKRVGCANTQKEPGCKESNNFTDEYVASKIYKSEGSDIECSALHLPIADPIGATPLNGIVPLEGKPYFTAIMGERSVCYSFSVKIPKNFHQFLPSSAARVVLCCREKEWVAKFCVNHQSMKIIRDGWKQFVVDNNLKLGDGCVFELLNNKELKFRVQILNGELPASAIVRLTYGKNIDNPILID